ncbi:MAG: hypothetical protein V3W08_08330 [Candidatus Binatia bacterium]
MLIISLIDLSACEHAQARNTQAGGESLTRRQMTLENERSPLPRTTEHPVRERWDECPALPLWSRGPFLHGGSAPKPRT